MVARSGGADVNAEIRHMNRVGDTETTDFFITRTGTMHYGQFVEVQGKQLLFDSGNAEESALTSALINATDVYTDYIFEKTTGAGVTIDSVLLKDGDVDVGANKLATTHMCVIQDTGQTNYIDVREKVSGTLGGINAGRFYASDQITTNTIGERSTGAGVTIDGCLIKDGVVAMDHGALTGLGDDDHTQYLPLSGIRAMTDELDMGVHSISNVQYIIGELNNKSVGMRGGLAFGAIVAAYGQDHATKAGQIQMAVPNAAKSGWVDALHINGVTNTPAVQIEHILKTDQVNEKTAGAGVTIDGILLKDHDIMLGSGYARLRSTAANALRVLNNAGTANGILQADKVIVDSYLQGDEIQELSAGQSVSFPDYLKTDQVNEKTAGAGVTIDGCLIKDGVAAFSFNIPQDYGSGGAIKVIYIDRGSAVNMTLVLSVQANTRAIGESYDGGNSYDSTNVITMTNNQQITAWTASGISLTYTKGDYVGVSVRRETAHASDTFPLHFKVMGIQFEYTT
jgi:hypothetical protein